LGTEAYIAGRKAKNKPENKALNSYMYGVMKMRQGRMLENYIQACFDEILVLLGDKNGLLIDFTEIYRAVHGVIVSNIHEFIRLGQTSDTDMTAV
jgi:hypothetical protein